ncbi:hypothetical protein HNR53_002223 [Bacillus benzoevorans]|nr:hypothetical protein [Bacillus benzoevorans]
MEKVGFTQVEFVRETGISTSRYTVGGIIRGKKGNPTINSKDSN